LLTQGHCLIESLLLNGNSLDRKRGQRISGPADKFERFNRGPQGARPKRSVLARGIESSDGMGIRGSDSDTFGLSFARKSRVGRPAPFNLDEVSPVLAQTDQTK